MSKTKPFQHVVRSVGCIIATVSRKEIVEQTISSLSCRATVPGYLVVVGATEKDLPDRCDCWPFHVDLVVAPEKGSATQRNYAAKYLPPEVEQVSFLDDDMEVHDEYFREIENVFTSCADVAGFSGCIIHNGEVDRTAGRASLDQHRIPKDMPAFGFYPRRWPGFYGCAMNIRRCWLAVEGFDERLPLYAVGEDCEMGFRLSRHGSVGGSARCPAVHLAVRSGRICEVGVGYAQIINYLYFAGKGIGYPRFHTYYEKLCRTPAVNFFFKLFPSLDRKVSIDRKGRFRGNLLALRDVMRGRIEPENLRRIVADHAKDQSE